MAVAAYGSLVSLINVLHKVHDRAQTHNIHVDINLVESLQEGINCLVEFVEVHSEREGLGDLWRQISRMAFEAEEMFDLHAVDQLQLRSQRQNVDMGISFNKDVDRVIQKVNDYTEKDLLVVQEVCGDVQTGKRPRMTALGGDSSSTAFTSGKCTMVGFDDHLRHIMDRLTNDQRNLQIIPIVGMGGIGKTTLAQNVYNNSLNSYHFDLCIWLTISQEYNVHQVLLSALNQVAVKNVGGSFFEPGVSLYKKLFDRKYLIVMDDVWDIDVWNDVSRFFPKNDNRSRVMITTRHADLASSLGFHDPYVLTFLDEAKSWNLFCQTIFAKDECPYPEFEEIGGSIAKSCRGLPLEIVVVGSHLANSEMTKESWVFVAENMKSFGDIENYQHCMEVLYISYKKLPIHLKLCFLYMRVFREDESVKKVKLIQQWIAAGYIKPNNGKDVWEIGKTYLNDLHARNLIARSNCYAVPPSLKQEAEDAVHMHDLFRTLCLREWKEENFINSPKIQLFELSQSNAQDACFHCGTLHCDAEATKYLESVVTTPTASEVSHVICRGCEVMYSELKRSRLVKVAKIVENDNFTRELVSPTQLRYADFNVQSHSLEFTSPSMLPLLWNLQTLFFSSPSKSSIVLPPEIWELPQLMRIQSTGQQDLVFPDASGSMVMLKYLSALREVRNLECTKEIFNRIPNLREFVIKYEDELGASDMQRLHGSLCNLIHLEKLKLLEIKNASLEHAIFPESLKHLYLERCKISWKDIRVVGSLPNLEILGLIKSGDAPEWIPDDRGFRQLKILILKSCNLRCWNADQVHFPKLEILVRRGLTLLEEIPSSIGDIGNLKSILIKDCNELVKMSAKKIWQEQQEVGNESLQIEIDGKEYLAEDEI